MDKYDDWAEKIRDQYEDYYDESLGGKATEWIASALREAVEEAHHDCTLTHKDHKCSFCRTSALEEAARIAEMSAPSWPPSVTAKAIRALKETK